MSSLHRMWTDCLCSKQKHSNGHAAAPIPAELSLPRSVSHFSAVQKTTQHIEWLGKSPLNFDFCWASKQLCSAFVGGTTVKYHFCLGAVVLYYWPLYPGVSVYFVKYQKRRWWRRVEDFSHINVLLKLCVLFKKKGTWPRSLKLKLIL